MVCQAAFSIFLRRHHCRSCGDVVCGTCCEAKREVYGLVGMHRVCDTCLANGVWVDPVARRRRERLDERPSDESSSGYHRQGTSDADVDEEEEDDEVDDEAEIHAFFAKHAPQDAGDATALWRHYERNRELMWRTLYARYNMSIFQRGDDRRALEDSKRFDCHDEINHANEVPMENDEAPRDGDESADGSVEQDEVADGMATSNEMQANGVEVDETSQEVDEVAEEDDQDRGEAKVHQMPAPLPHQGLDKEDNDATAESMKESTSPQEVVVDAMAEMDDDDEQLDLDDEMVVHHDMEEAEAALPPEVVAAVVLSPKSSGVTMTFPKSDRFKNRRLPPIHDIDNEDDDNDDENDDDNNEDDEVESPSTSETHEEDLAVVVPETILGAINSHVFSHHGAWALAAALGLSCLVVKKPRAWTAVRVAAMAALVAPSVRSHVLDALAKRQVAPFPPPTLATESAKEVTASAKQ
ncbi:Aste57867_21057 [Aphanomyces stellatus]|uniref:Aste57867_21057 protein n=1 Tax=Aphanomyces stellatus TaxID=120398 RepID=A0A485LGM2_9STRA|nr:hypothetical protein As57867_020989 [Aphanomyces stellatus]VFT97732.1 Aste57867_21057 [Aphanomyces stellatus]